MARAKEQRRSEGVTQRHIENEPVPHLLHYLVATLGTRLTGYAIGVTQRPELTEYRRGKEPSPELERRIRNLYAITWRLATGDGPGSAHAWLIEPNPELDGRTPVDCLREGESPETVWMAASF